MTKLDWTTTVTTGPGGIRTEEAGTLDGEITLRTFWSDTDNLALVTVQHHEIREWYTVAGGPVPADSKELAEAVHQAAVAAAREGDDATAG
ncbi:hypothetical protein ACFRAQ_26785 [Nocardia sp. NPDC056611]|uniref:hypothetical protein n=1 Tax=unclassified Nocardia TaxID=2637762 RepID=UPI003671DBB6